MMPRPAERFAHKYLISCAKAFEALNAVIKTKKNKVFIKVSFIRAGSRIIKQNRLELN
jgi:hypothetical protein